MQIPRDPRLCSLEWRDLTQLSRTQIATELLLSLPWLAGSLYLASLRFYAAALGFSFIFFLAGLRQVHGACHYSVGVSRSASEWLLFLMSVVMLGSMHAVQVNHLRHHKYCLREDDIEARSAGMSGWRAILGGPVFPLRLCSAALRYGNARQRRWIRAELLANAIWVAVILAFPNVHALRYHVVVMAAGQCLTSFFAVWTVHHGCEPSRHRFARTLRGYWANTLTMHMFFHVEHHLFPCVPTCHLHQLAERLDRVAPEYREMSVL
ncbi:MAG: fatty acid desaturase [Acidobacteria bacterium]|nr:fatty acid desaturase [Acidobacteriota bacterium]